MRHRWHRHSFRREVAGSDGSGQAAVNAAYADLAEFAGGLRFAGDKLSLEVLHLVRPPPGAGPAEHLHPVLEVSCVMAGAFTWTTGSQRIDFGPGDILLMPPYRRHSWVSADGPGEILGLMLDVSGDLEGARLERAVRKLGYRLHADEPLIGLLRRLREEMETRTPPDRILAGHCLRTVMVLILDAIRGQAPAPRVLPTSNAAKVVAKARDFMLAHLAEHLGVAEVATGIGLSSRHIDRCFHEAAGVPPAVLLRMLRMEMARHLLLREDIGIREIALRCGFRNDSHFCRVFKQHLGLPPGEWRKRGDVVFGGAVGEMTGA